ncbi:MAG: hypothetical protein ETSY1_00675 [Candidatus Entotheonella factor]|uniref:Lipoprotein n=1 Tax=Entotheonella factor TaxID=1429438 RepID=W4LZ88_ENTF1|nr:MAG: hypothetical protein ETSY1_00675 [Candidatus Entotheonella factor]
MAFTISQLRFGRLLAAVVLFAALTGCAYHQAVNKLSPQEQSTFRAYQKVINGSQARTYLSKPTPVERQAYLQDIGVVQRFEALDQQDQDAILKGYIRKGMHADALNFLWGRPQRKEGNTGKWEHWFYSGHISDLVAYGNSPYNAGTSVEVFLVDNQVEWWFEGATESIDDPGIDRKGIRR